MLKPIFWTFALILAIILSGCIPPRADPTIQPVSHFNPTPSNPKPTPGPTSTSKPTSVLTSSSEPTSASILYLTEIDAGRTIVMQKGDTIQVTLEGNPTTGYNWEWEPSNTKIISQVGEPEFVPNSNSAGSPGKIKLAFKGENEGQLSLFLVYHRPWEKDVPPTNSFDVNVIVGGTGLPTLPPSPTMVPQAIPTTVVFPAAGMKGWLTYTNRLYHFSFQYPPEWGVEEGKGTMLGHAILLTPNTEGNARLQIAFKLANDDRQIGRAGLGSGELVTLGKVVFLGKEINRSVLVSDNKQMTVRYLCAGCMQRGDLIFGFDLDYLGNGTDPTGLSEDVEALADLVVASIKITN